VVIGFNGSRSVYHVLNTANNRDVVLKASRMFGSFGYKGRDGIGNCAKFASSVC